MITDSDGNLGVATVSPQGIALLNAQRDLIIAGATFNRNPRIDSDDRQMPYAWSWSVGFSQQLFGNAAVGIDYVGNASRDQLGVVDINEPVNGVRPGVDVFDPDGELIPAEARRTNFARVLQTQSGEQFDGDYKSLQLSLNKRMANRWSGRLAYTLQKSNYVGLGNPDARRVWLDNEISADYGRFQSDRRHVLAMSATVNPFSSFNIATVLSTITGSPINETVGTDVNGDGDNNDRPVKGVNDLVIPIRSEVDSQGRAVINGLEGPGSFLVDMSFRYSVPVKRVLTASTSSTTSSTSSTPRTWCRRRAIAARELHGVDVGAVRTADAVRRARAVLDPDPATGLRATGDGRRAGRLQPVACSRMWHGCKEVECVRLGSIRCARRSGCSSG